MRHVFFPVQAAELKDSPSARAVAERHEAWKTDLPEGRGRALGLARRARRCQPQGAAGPLRQLSASTHSTRRPTVMAARAYRCTASSVVSATPIGSRGGPARHGRGRLAADSRQLSRPRHQAPHPRSGAPGEGRAVGELIGHLKKADMAKEAERLLDGTGWLPEPLRPKEAAAAKSTDGDPARGRWHAARLSLRRRRRPAMTKRMEPAVDRRRVTSQERGGVSRPARLPRHARPCAGLFHFWRPSWLISSRASRACSMSARPTMQRARSSCCPSLHGGRRA